ncbi:MAG: ubiquinol oxidase, subunit [Candidatus Adlerbacteria bacterium]|nr:ubiquinol oxidase, subunit [Candidatus Adlerbacteria bacterium]
MFSVLSGSGIISAQESALMVQATLFMLIIIVPVLGLLFFFAWRYRAHSGARYEPDWEHSMLDEVVWWAVPIEIVLVLGALTWISTHNLDPHKQLVSNTPALTVEVVALPWKWLFIYPEYGIATVNTLIIPANTPINFSITADAPMNSFWIPALGGQMYAMTGMATPLSLMANQPGVYQGLSANYSGEGFADMRFTAEAMTPQDFALWATSVTGVTSTMSWDEYEKLAQPGTTTPNIYSHADPALFDEILEKYNQPGYSGHHH